MAKRADRGQTQTSFPRSPGTDRDLPGYSTTDIAWILGLLVIAMVSYANVLSAPFLFDDYVSIVENSSIRSLWPPAFPLSPPHDTPVAGRPFSNLSFALNYAVSGLEVRSYRIVNLGIHWACGALLFALVRRTRLAIATHSPDPRAESTLAFASAALWLAHPLASEVVDYVTQRTESLMAFFYLLTLYCVSRVALAGAAGRARSWSGAAVIACALGMTSKEVMVTAPLVALLYDASYFAGSPIEALRRRRPLYVGLASTWLLLGALTLGGTRAQSVGASLGITPWTYLSNQIWVVSDYLRNVLWPVSLSIDYGWPLELTPLDVPVQTTALSLLLIGIVWLGWRSPRWGFPALAAILILAPSSSILPIVTEVGAERRMYLPLAAICVLAVVGGDYALRRRIRAPRARLLGLLLISVALITSIAMTRERNRDYASELTLWRSAIEANPHNPRAHLNLGAAQLAAGDLDAAERHVRESLQLKPGYPRAVAHLGRLALARGDLKGAERSFRRSLEMDPRQTDIQTNLGGLLLDQGRVEEAMDEWRAALARDPGLVYAANNLAWVLATAENPELRDPAEALELALRAARGTGFSSPQILRTLGAAHAGVGQWVEAAEVSRRGAQLAHQSGNSKLANELERQAADYDDR